MTAKHEYNLRVYYEDTDAGGIVYHASYLRFAERARTEMLRDNGFEHVQFLNDTGIAFAVRHLSISYERPATLDDTLTVQTQMTDMGKARMDLKQDIYNGETLLATITLTLVCMNIQTKKAARLPEECRAVFSEMM